jgi:exonuclease-1
MTGLLPLLKSIQQPCSLKKFAGQTIGVDAYGWLHRGTAACAIELAQDKPTTKFVDFAMNRVRMLVHFGITPYIVFDGDYLPSKGGTEKERAERRREGKRLGLELLKVGKTSQAQLELQKAVDVTPEMARMLIEELKYHNIQYVVAPFEADSQLAYLERQGIINGILSEDSDLLVFGAKCLITKLDKYGECVEINRNRFTACREISLVGWTDADFRRMAILSGCDYLPSIGSMGLKTAYRMLRKHKNVERLVKAAQFDGKFKVPAGYIDAFYQAEKTFLHQWVFCPISNRVLNLTPPESEADIAKMPFIGEEVPPHIAFGVARGELHPHTKQPLVVRTENNRSGKPLRPQRAASATAQTPIGKHSKPIDSFFKPKRTPLAELDVNLFTPSPSQQALLEQQRNSSSWEPVSAPQTGVQQQLPATRTAPQPARRAISDSAGMRRSAPNPSKRQRLCSDLVSDTPDASNDQVTRSKFFASVAEPSPSLRTTRHRRKKSSLDFELFSDDSVEEAMAQFADLDEAASQPKKKIKIFKDSAFSFENDSQSSASSKLTTQTSQESQESGTLTPATSHGSPEPETLCGATRQVQSLRSQFSYVASTSAATTVTRSVKPNLTRTTNPRKHGSPAVPRVSVARTPQPISKVTDVHRLQHEDADLLQETDWKAAEEEIVVAASSDVEPTTPRKSPMAMRREVKGSEEFLVPDSDAESVCSPRKPLMNLGRFAFDG